MIRSKHRHFPFHALVLAAFLVAGIVASASAKDPKHAFGEVKAFDGVVLTVTMSDGGELVSPVAVDAQIKISHGSNKDHAKHSKSPSHGSLADLVPGATVLKIKIKCEEVVKVRITPAPAEPATAATVEKPSEGSDEGAEDGEEASPEHRCDADHPGDDDADEDSTDDHHDDHADPEDVSVFSMSR